MFSGKEKFGIIGAIVLFAVVIVYLRSKKNEAEPKPYI